MNVTLAMQVGVMVVLTAYVFARFCSVFEWAPRLNLPARRRSALDLERLEHEALEPRLAAEWGHSSSCATCCAQIRRRGVTITNCRAVNGDSRGFPV